MPTVLSAQRGLYFEEFEVGDRVISNGRTVTEADIVNFAGLSGDFNQIHTNAEFAARDTFGRRIAHGLLIQAISTGLATATGVIEGTVLAFREVHAKFSLPTYIGDTIHLELEVIEKKAFARLGGGNIHLKFNVINQDGQSVQRGEWVMLMKSRPQNNSAESSA